MHVPGVPTATTIGSTKRKDVPALTEQTRELSELLESMTQGCLQDKQNTNICVPFKIDPSYKNPRHIKRYIRMTIRLLYVIVFPLNML